MKIKNITLIFLPILILFGACKQQAGEPGLRKVRVVLDWTPNTNHAGVYAAKEMGWYEELGLDLQIIQPGENTAEKIVASSQAEFGFSYQESVSIARSESLPIKSIAAVIQHNSSGFASLKSARIHSPKDFAGKRYGSSSWPSELDILRQVMHNEGASFESLTVVSGIHDFFSTIGRDVDFAWIFYGWDGVRAEITGVDINFIPAREIDPIFDFYTPVLITNDFLANSEPQLMKDFLDATARGYELCKNDPKKAAELLLKAVPELDEELVHASLEYLSQEFQGDAPRWGQQDPLVWKRFADWMYEKRIIRIAINSLEAFTNEFLP